MSMSWSEHVKQAELLVREVEKDFATAQSDHDLRRVEITINIAQTHVMLAETKRVRT